MALRDKLSQRVSPFLQPGEQLQHVFVGQTKSGWWSALGLLGLLLTRPKLRAVAVTDRRIVLLQGSIWSLAAVKGFVAEGPRRHLGEPSGMWWKCEALPEPLYVHARFHKDVRAANQSIG